MLSRCDIRVTLGLCALLLVSCWERGGDGGDADADVDTDVDADTDTDTDTDTDPGRTEWTPPEHTPINPVDLDLSGLEEDHDRFPAGVLSGDPQPGSMLLWTLATETADLRLKVWLPDIAAGQPRRVDLIHDAPVIADPSGYVHVRVNTVVPGRRHGYAFVIEPTPGAPTARSRIGYFKAAPPVGELVRLTVSGTHGTNQGELPWEALITNAELGPFDLYIHLGDAIYGDGSSTIEHYRNHWIRNWQTEGFRAVLGEAAYLMVWDDHEVTNNYNPETLDPALMAMGHQAFYEANPLDQYPDRHYRSWTWGDTAEFFALDCRSERLPSGRETEAAQYISPAQMAWLMDGLRNSTATFKLVLNSVPIIDFGGLWDAAQSDRWEGYAAQRDELLAFLDEEQIPNVYFSTGDFHMATVGRLDPPGGAGHEYWEFMFGPGSQSNPLGNRQQMIDLLGEDWDPLPPDQFLWGWEADLASFVDFDPFAEPPTMTLRYYDPTGAPLFRAVFADGALVESEIY